MVVLASIVWVEGWLTCEGCIWLGCGCFWVVWAFSGTCCLDLGFSFRRDVPRASISGRSVLSAASFAASRDVSRARSYTSEKKIFCPPVSSLLRSVAQSSSVNRWVDACIRLALVSSWLRRRLSPPEPLFFSFCLSDFFLKELSLLRFLFSGWMLMSFSVLLSEVGPHAQIWALRLVSSICSYEDSMIVQSKHAWIWSTRMWI